MSAMFCVTVEALQFTYERLTAGGAIKKEDITFYICRNA